MDNKKNNMKQAMFEMFGVGSDVNAQSAAPVKEAPKQKTAPQNTKKAAEKVTEAPARKAAVAPSFLAAGTVFEGNLHSEGDVEISGSFKGDISTEGTVILRSNIQGNVSAACLNLYGCKLEGDVNVKGAVSISEDSVICGNVVANELQCAGQITGDLRIAEHTLLESSAKINGSVVTGTIAVIKGAVIKGGIEIKAANA